ncbi:MAG: transcriptional repressor [Fusobacteriaceae bacterium]|nr:transcriptional repressor [Fusobacteriaceae bacterium]
MQVENIGNFLKSKDIRPSYQRIKVYQYLIEHKNHPTVDMIYKALGPEITTLSKTTVYNTLNLFIQHGIVNMIVIEENETRYDADMHTHGHFKCVKCGKLNDVMLPEDVIDRITAEGCDVKEKHIYMKGLCRECKESVNKLV